MSEEEGSTTTTTMRISSLGGGLMMKTTTTNPLETMRQTDINGSPKSALEFGAGAADSNRGNSDEFYDCTTSDDDGEEEEETTEDDNNLEDDNDHEASASDLIQAAQNRFQQQKYMEELKIVRLALEEKETEMGQLSASLKLALATKNDLISANQELEGRLEGVQNQLTTTREEWKRSRLAEEEIRAQVQKEFLNEMNDLVTQVSDSGKTIQQLQKKLAEFEAQSNSEARLLQALTDKDETIRCLQEKVHKLEREGLRGQRRDSSKVQYYKVRLGMN